MILLATAHTHTYMRDRSCRYTARAPHTCAKFAASCMHELIDIKQWANWTVDYMKDDSCVRPLCASCCCQQRPPFFIGRSIVVQCTPHTIVLLPAEAPLLYRPLSRSTMHTTHHRAPLAGKHPFQPHLHCSFLPFCIVQTIQTKLHSTAVHLYFCIICTRIYIRGLSLLFSGVVSPWWACPRLCGNAGSYLGGWEAHCAHH